MDPIKLDAVKNIFEKGEWYHTFEYKNIKTNGTFDFNPIISKLNFPNLSGKNILDVGCSDGFFSFYFKKYLNAKNVLGVDANKYDGSVNFEVLDSFRENQKEKHALHFDYENLIDDYRKLELDSPNKFNLINKIFNLNLDFKFGSVYDLSNFSNYDVTFCGSLLEHLRDPISAIEQLYFKTDEICIIDVSNPFTKLNFLNQPLIKYSGASGHFYRLSENAVTVMMKSVGFKSIEIISKYKIKNLKHKNFQNHFVVLGKK